jgi:hypothetical protein
MCTTTSQGACSSVLTFATALANSLSIIICGPSPTLDVLSPI